MQRLVTHTNPEARPTPLLLLAALRALDETIELVYVGRRQWWLGSVRANEERAATGRRILEQMEKLDRVLWERPTIAANVMLGRLLLQGFARIEAYEDHGDPSGVCTVAAGTDGAYDTTILEDFRERDFHWRKDNGDSFMGPLQHEAMTGEEKQRRIREREHDYLVNDGRDHYHRLVRHRVLVGYTAPPRRIITNLSGS